MTASGANAITQTGPIVQAAGAGAASFTTGAGAITLNTATNNFTGPVSLTNTGLNNVSITDTNALALGTVNVGSGTLAIQSNGALTQAGAITQAAGAGAVTVNAGAGAITLNNVANDFVGAVGLTNSGANNVAVTDANAIVLGASSVGSGTFAVTASGANSITQTGAIVQAAGAGAASFTTRCRRNHTDERGEQLRRRGESQQHWAEQRRAHRRQRDNRSARSSVGSGTLAVTASGANSITQTGAIVQAAGAGAASFTTGAGGRSRSPTRATTSPGRCRSTNSGANNGVDARCERACAGDRHGRHRDP